MIDHARHPLDAYDTPPELAEAIVADVFKRGRIVRALEPTAGTGSFVRALAGRGAKVAAIDLDPACKAACLAAGASTFFGRDVLALDPISFASVDLAIGNPPFKAAEEIIRHLWGGLPDGASISFLLAITFWAGKDRWNEVDGLYTVAPLRFVQPITPRPYFGLDNDPKFEAALFTWTKGWTGTTSCPAPIRWTKPGRAARAKLRTFEGTP